MATSVPLTSVPPPAKVRNVCFTLNNYNDDDITRLSLLKEGVSYLVYGKEVGESGTPHLQGYVEFENPRATGKGWSNMKKLIGNAHFEVRRGTAKQASEYCMKEDKECYIFGEISRQGERTDWVVATQQLLGASSVVDVIQEQPSLLPAIRALERLKVLSIEPIHREVHVTWLYGSPGSGKTRYVWDLYPNVYSKPTGMWWDGYNGEDVLLLDDFDADIQFSELLKVLDRYKYRIPVKGGFIGARWSKVFITTNEHPNTFYRYVHNRSALDRRINEIKCFPLV